MTGSSHIAETGSERPAKRKKVAAACEPCRNRKVKCDGSRPACKPCRDRHNEQGCQYTAHNATYDESRERYIDELEARLRRLDQRSLQTQVLTPPADRSSTSAGSLASIVTTHERPSPNTYNAAAHGTSAQQQGTRNDALNTVIAIGAAPQLVAGKPYVAVDADGRILEDYGAYPLPPKKTADYLFGVYWEYLHFMYPAVDRFSTQRCYEALWNNGDLQCDRLLFYCALNAMFASATQVLNEENAHEKADAYFKRTKDLLNLDAISSWSIQLVQTLILCIQYLQSADEPQKCKTFVTLAVRAAQGLELHLPSTADSLPDPVQQRTARRIWHCCVIYDKVLAMSLSQPPLLGLSDSDAIPVVSMSDTEYTMFVSSIPLFRRLHDVLSNFYNLFKVDTGALPVFSADELLNHEEGFAAWENSLPENLRFHVATSRTRPASEVLVASFLQERYLQVRIMFYRPALSAILQRNQEPSSTYAAQSVRTATLLTAAIACFESSTAMLHIISDRVQESKPGKPCSIWWLDVYFAYTAATVVLAVKFTPTVSRHLDPHLIDLAVQQYTYIFQHHSQQHRAAARCLTALTRLSSNAGPKGPLQTAYPPARPNDIPTTTDTNDTVVDTSAESGGAARLDSGGVDEQLDTLDYANWLAAAPLDFTSSNWDDWLVDLDASFPKFDIAG